MSNVLSFLGNMLMQILGIQLPFGITFGTMLIGSAFFCVLVSVVKTIFTSIGTGISGAVRRKGEKDE